jgi:hypothetical protein
MVLKIKEEKKNMMLPYNGLINLFDIVPDKQFWAGSIFRQYDVDRLDVKKTEDNYYDLMLVDVSNYITGSFALVNITLNSDNRGRIVATIPEVSTTYFLTAEDLQNYFSRDTKIYFVEDVGLIKK